MTNWIKHVSKYVSKNVSKHGTPIAILVGTALIAISIFVSFGHPKYKMLALYGEAGPKAPGLNAPVANNKPIDVSADDDAFLGSAAAAITLIEFADYQCPFCRKFWKDTLPQIKEKYIDTGKVKFVYRDFPLSFHPAAQASAEAAECAGDQGKYWQMHDKIYEEQEKKGAGTVQYSADDLKAWAGQIGLRVSEFNNCLDSGKNREEVLKDFADGQAAGVTGTPVFFLNGKPIKGAQSYAAFEHID
jgi:protein-disulfide isomerase